jgi:hypothetical protein
MINETTTAVRDPMEDNIIHTLLVTSNRLQRIPALWIAAMLLVFALLTFGIASLFRPTAVAVWIAVVTGALSLFDWFSLWALPRAGRSFGPDRPSGLALGAVRAVVMMVLSVLIFIPLWALLLISALITLTALYATWVEPFNLGVTWQTYRHEGWSAENKPLRLLHIGDLHVERLTHRERRLNTLIDELQPDVIVFSGDFVNISYADDPAAIEDIRALIREWQAPLGVYCVPGTYTVEPLQLVRETVRDLDNLRLLEDEWVQLETPVGELNILGMVTTHYTEKDRETLRELAALAPPDGLKLLLTHAPDVAPEADQLGFDLYLCGHTHGGQLRFPVIGAVFSGSALGMDFVMGRYDLENVTVYTSRGVGLEGLGAPRARFLCPPEIIMWEIEGASRS